MAKIRLILVLVFAVSIVATSSFRSTYAFPDMNSPLEDRIKAATEAETHGSEAISALAEYREDDSDLLRLESYRSLWRIGVSSEEDAERQYVVRMLVEGMGDESVRVRQMAARWLLSFRTKDFSAASKGLLQGLFAVEPSYDVLLIYGIADMKSELPRLDGLLTDETKYQGPGQWYGTVSWATRLARARMGSQPDILRCIELVEAEPNSVIRVTRLLGDLAYTRQPQAIDVLWRYLESDERLPSVKETVPGSRYCQYALDLLAQSLEGFPVKSVGTGYSQSEIDLCRDWMRSQEEFEIIS